MSEEVEKVVTEPEPEPQVQDTPDPLGMSMEDLSKITSGTDNPVDPEPEPKEPEPEPELDQDKVTLSKEEHEKLLKQLKDKETFIQRQGNEIGTLRKAREALQAATAALPADEQAEIERLNKLALDNPMEFAKQRDEFVAKKQEQIRQTAIVQHLEQINQNRERTLAYVPEIEEAVNDLAETIKEDGATVEQVEAFKQNPYSFDPAVLFNLHKRITLSKENTALKTELEQLRAENEELKKRPDSILKNIENASRTRTITSKTGGGGQQSIYDESTDPLTLSIGELRKITGRTA